MTGDRDIETFVRRHLAAEAAELPFFLDGERVRRRLAERRRRPWRLLALVPVAAALMLAVLLGQALLAGPGPDESGGPVDWGPLAVVPTAGGDQALNTGTLRTTQSCVFLETGGGESELLVWPADRTRWDAAADAIGFTNSDGTEVTLRDGEPVSFGGGGDSTAEGGVSGEEWLARVDWVARPDPSCPMEIRWYVNEVVSPRAAFPEPYVVVESREFPGVEIACQGEVRLAGDACQAWGEELLADPALPAGVRRVVLTANAGNARCAADFYVADDRPAVMTAAVVCPSTPSPAGDGSPPPLNDLEARIVDALDSLGVDGQRAEYSSSGAFIWAPLDDESAVFVHAYRTGSNRGEFSIIGEQVIAGRTVQRVEYTTGPIRERFECGDVAYEAEGATPLGFASFDAFVAALITALGCATA